MRLPVRLIPRGAPERRYCRSSQRRRSRGRLRAARVLPASPSAVLVLQVGRRQLLGMQRARAGSFDGAKVDCLYNLRVLCFLSRRRAQLPCFPKCTRISYHFLRLYTSRNPFTNVTNVPPILLNFHLLRLHRQTKPSLEDIQLLSSLCHLLAQGSCYSAKNQCFFLEGGISHPHPRKHPHNILVTIAATVYLASIHIRS